MLSAESGQPSKPGLSRKLLAHELNIVEGKSSQDIPLLYTMVEKLKTPQVHSLRARKYDLRDPTDDVNLGDIAMANDTVTREDIRETVIVEDYANDLPTGIAFTN